MKRRDLLAMTAAEIVARPSLNRPALAQSGRVLRFVPQGNLANPDPVWTTTTLARNHGLMVWDTLYGVTNALEPRPQMVEGHEILDDGRTWRFTLRERLAFHDNEPVRPADCIASIQRWPSAAASASACWSRRTRCAPSTTGGSRSACASPMR